MTLATGSRLGVHEIVDLPGSGGMGVLRAGHQAQSAGGHQGAAGLPATRAGDPDRVARFHRELAERPPERVSTGSTPAPRE